MNSDKHLCYPHEQQYQHPRTQTVADAYVICAYELCRVIIAKLLGHLYSTTR